MMPATVAPAVVMFVLTGQPKPSGLWATAFGRWLCRMHGHHPDAAAMQMSDNLPRAVIHTWAWGCPRCGLRFAYCHAQGLDQDPAHAQTAHLSHTHALYLDLLHETNKRRAALLLPPVRSIPQVQARIVELAR